MCSRSYDGGVLCFCDGFVRWMLEWLCETMKLKLNLGLVLQRSYDGGSNV
jgi:hypothetical protein